MLDEALRKLPREWRVFQTSITLTQESDSCDESGLGQDLEIRTDDAGAGPFIVLKTERWAMDKKDLDPLLGLLTAMLAHTDRGESEK